VVREGRYQAQLSDWRLPRLATSFLCQSLLEEADHQYGRAARAALHAAWTCDDQPLRKRQALACRRRVVQLIHEAARRGQEVESEEWTGKVVLTDILRRSGDFASAAEECQRQMILEDDERLRSQFEYEALLIQRHDSERRALIDVIRWAPAVWEVQASVRGATEARVVGIGVGLLIFIGISVVAFVLGPILLVVSVILLVGLVALSLARRLRA
jgi:hypothetical protein